MLCSFLLDKGTKSYYTKYDFVLRRKNMNSLKQLNQLNLLTSEINGVFHETSVRLGLSDSASIILYTLCTNEGSCQLSDIVKLSGVSKQTINSALRKLEKEEFVVLTPMDQRRKRVSLTEKGAQLAQQTVAKMIDKEKRMFDSWTEEEMEAYVRLTQRYLNDIRQAFREIV